MEEISLKLRQRNPEAFKVFFFSYKDAIYKYALMHVKDESIAADVVQDVFLKFWNKVETMDPSQNIKSYLFTVTKHRVYDEIRRNMMFSTFTKHEIALQSYSTNCNEEHQNFRELQDIHQEAISSLPAKRKQIYELSKVENLSNQEIAAHLSISINTVRDQLVKANKCVKKFILSKGKYILPAISIIKENFFE